jgi:hypothetical protein
MEMNKDVHYFRIYFKDHMGQKYTNNPREIDVFMKARINLI